jgi:ABC-2 type transport system permease protein
MKIALIARHQIRLFSKSLAILVLFVVAPFFIIYIFGQAFTSIFAASGAGIRAMDYFGITLLTLAVFQGTSIASWGVFKEKKSNTEPRLAIAPIGKGEVVYGTFIGTWISLYFLSCLVLLLVKVFLSVNYGPSIALTLLLLAAETSLAAALGVSCAVLVDQERTANGIINAVVPFLVFLGGGYTVIPESGFLHDISVLSPIRWLNLAMITAIRPGPNEYIGVALSFCLLLSACLLGLAGIKVWRRR